MGNLRRYKLSNPYFAGRKSRCRHYYVANSSREVESSADSESLWSFGNPLFLLASARQKPVDNRAEFSHFHFSQFGICVVMLCSAMDAPKGHDNFVGNIS